MQEDLTFVHSVPSFPVARKAASFTSFEERKEVSHEAWKQPQDAS